MDLAIFFEYFVAFAIIYLTIFYILLVIQNRQRITKLPKIKDWTPKISFIIPAFNEEENIAKCIESILAADYPMEKKEIVVVDDGSHDDTSKIARSYSKKYPVKVFRKKNEGKAIALNYGIERASGELIATIDADSFVAKDAIKKMLPLFDSEEVAAATSAVKVYRPKNFLEKLQAVEYIYAIFTRKMLALIDSVYVTPGPLSIFRKKVLDEVGYFDPNNITEDQEIALRIQSHNYKIRSSLDAAIYTKVPKTFKALLRQRIRWHRGGLRNAVKYLNLIHPRYGDFGVFIMPFSLLAIFLLVGVLVLNIYRAVVNTKFVITDFSLSSFLVSVTPLQLFGIVILLLTMWWGFYALSFLPKENLKLKYIVLFVLIYPYLITLFWLATFFEELRLAKLRW